MSLRHLSRGLALILAAASSTMVFGQVAVRGRVVMNGLNGPYAVQSIAVTARNSQTDQRSKASYTDVNGIFVIEDLEYADYVIEIWSQGFEWTPLTYKVKVTLPKAIDNLSFNSTILRKLSAADRTQLNQLYRLDSTGKVYSLRNPELTPDMTSRLTELLKKAEFTYYYDLAPVDISEKNTSMFQQLPMKF